MAIGTVAGAVVGDEVGKAAERNGGLEAVGVADDPVCRVAAVAAAGDAHAVFIDPRIFLKSGIDAVHHVGIIVPAPLAVNTAFELLPVPGRTARICEQNGVSLCRINLKLVVPVNAILP